MDVSYWGLVRIFQQSYTLANTLSSGYQENLRFFVSQVTPVPSAQTQKKNAIQVAHRSPFFFLSVPIF